MNVETLEEKIANWKLFIAIKRREAKVLLPFLQSLAKQEMFEAEREAFTSLLASLQEAIEAGQ